MRMRMKILLPIALCLAASVALAAENGLIGAPERPGMVYVPAGDFPMGSSADDAVVFDFEKPREQPQRRVWVDAFFIDRFEVTNEQYAKHDPKHVPDHRSACANCPVTEVTWQEASDFCAAQTPPKRLPTEAEWEKAAKGGSEKRLEPVEDYAWYLHNAGGQTHPVGQKKPNGYGLYDVLGNAREWTADWYDPEYYKRTPAGSRNPKGPATGKRKVERGGTFFMFRRSVSETIRYNHPPHFRLYFLGFRCAADVARNAGTTGSRS